MMDEMILELSHITKRFPGVLALDDSWLRLNKGEVHGLIGENGAGKSTLMKILCGIYQKDSGQILLEGEPVSFLNTRESLAKGICMIHQELNLMPHLTVAQNIFIGRENEGKNKKSFFITDRDINHRAKEYLEELHMNVLPTTKVSELPVAKQQMVEIVKAISYRSKILIMDEPTAALTNDEIEDLFRIVRKLKQQGMAIVYISHRMDELKRICDKITIMRDGKTIETRNMDEITIDEIIAKMVGRELAKEDARQKRELAEDYILEVKNLCGKKWFRNISFQLKRGEILGFAGLMGAGRTEMARAIFGADPYESGEICLNGEPIQIRKTSDAVRYGIGYLSEDRKAFGILQSLPVSENIVISSYENYTKGGFVKEKECRNTAQRYVELLRIKTPSIDQRIKFLSGGNQQKAIIAKWLLKDCKILIFDEPTRGIDIGAKNEIYDLLRELADQGKSIIMISSEMSEILRLSDRIAVMCEGRITGILDGCTATQEQIMKYATAREREEDVK